MVKEVYKKRANYLVKIAKEKGKVIKYKDFCKTKEAKETALTKEEITHYISKKEEEKK